MEPGVMLSAIREYSVKEQRIFMQKLSPEPANAVSGKGFLAVGSSISATQLASLDGRRTRSREGGEEDSNFLVSGEPAGIRTQDPRLKRALLYQLSYELTQFPG